YAWPVGRPWIGQVARLANGMDIEIDALDTIGKHILKTGCYEHDTFHFLCRILRPGMVFLDIGANIGQYTLLASQRVGPVGDVHAFEPHPTLFDVLVRNVDRNRCRNVTTVP